MSAQPSLSVDFGATGSVVASTPGGNGPGLIFHTPDSDRWDTFAWNGGYQIRKDGTSTLFQFSDDGRFGIGTETPDGPLDIDFGATGSVVASTPGGNGPGLIFHTPDSDRWDTFAWNGGYQIRKDGTSTLFQFSDDRRFGLGTETPASEIHLIQTGDAVSNGIRIEATDGTHWNTYIDGGVGDDYNFALAGTLKAYIQDMDGSYTQVSDEKLKRNIEPLEEVLPGVLQLQPKWYNYVDNAKGAPKTLGFIAQEVEEHFPNIIAEKNGLKALAYDNFGVLAIKAIQELHATVEEKEERIGELESEVATMNDRLQRLEALLSLNDNQQLPIQRNILLEGNELPRLKQNAPNPFNEATTIQYHLPKGTQDAYLRITNEQGQILKMVKLEGTGAGQVNLTAAELPSGTYVYSLMIGGKVIHTKQMILTAQ